VYTPKYMNPALMNLKFKHYVIEDFAETREAILNERQKRLDNLDNYKNRASYRPNTQGASFSDIETALKGLDFLEHYVLNNNVSESEWEAFMVYIRKTDEIWKQNFNDHMVNYKFTGNNIIRNLNV